MAEYGQIRAEIHNWSLESDDRLFRKIELFAQNFLNKVDFMTADVKNTDFSINCNQVEVGNAFSKFLNLSNHKFTENKMQPFNDSDLLRKSQAESDLIPLSLDTNTNIVERYQQALNFGMENVNLAQYMNQSKEEDDDRLSVSDAGERSYSIYSENSVLPGKNNKLPYIIGTRAFLEDDYIGIYENPDQQIKPEILSFQEISLPESNIKVESNYIPKIEQPPPLIPQKDPLGGAQQNNNEVPNPPPLLNSSGMNGVIVNQTAPPPPPNLLLPGLKPGPLNIMPPTLLSNNQNQTNIPSLPGDGKILAPPPLNILLQNQGKSSNNANNLPFNLPPPTKTFSQPPFGMQNQQPPPQFQQNMQNPNPQIAEPLDFKAQLALTLANKNKPPFDPNSQINMQQSNPGIMNTNPNQYSQNIMNSGSNMGNNQINNNNMNMPPQFLMNNANNMNMPQMNYNNNMNMVPNNMVQNFTGSQNLPGYAYHLSESQIPQIDLAGNIMQNQNYYPIPPQNYQSQNYQPQNSQPQNFPPPMNQFNQNPQINVQPPLINTNSNKINVNSKAPPPPNLKTLIHKEDQKKSESSLKSNPNQHQPIAQPQISNPIPPPMNFIPNTGSSLQDELLAKLNKKNQPQPQPQINNEQTTAQNNQNQSFQNQTMIQSNQRENSQFRESLNALQKQEQNEIIEDNGNNSKANLRAQLEKALQARGGSNINPKPTERNEDSNQNNSNNNYKPTEQSLTVPNNRPSLKFSKSVDVDKLETLYKPKKKKKGDNLFDDDGNESQEESDSEKNDIFGKSEKKKNSKFDDLLTKPAKIPPPEIIEETSPEKQEKFEKNNIKPTITEPVKNLETKNISTFNAKKIEDTFIVTKSNDLFINKEELMQKSKVQDIDKNDKFSKLFGNDSDEDEDKNTEKMKQMYAQEAKLKRSATTAIPQPKNTSKVSNFFQDRDSDEEGKTSLGSKSSAKPILKEKKPNHYVDEVNDLLEEKSNEKFGFEKKPSVRFNLDQNDNEIMKYQQKSDEKVKKSSLFDEDEDSLKNTKKIIFDETATKDFLQSKPIKIQGETPNPLYKNPMNLREENSESPETNKLKPIEKVMSEEVSQKVNNPLISGRPSNKPLNFFDEPSEALGAGIQKIIEKQPLEEPSAIKESANVLKQTLQQPTEPLEKIIKVPEDTRPSKKPFNFFDEPSEALGMSKTKPIEESRQVNANPLNEIFDQPKEKTKLNVNPLNEIFDEPSKSKEKTKIIEESPKNTNLFNEKPSNKIFNFYDEPSEGLGKMKNFEETQPKNHDRINERPSKKDFNFYDEPSEALEKPKIENQQNTIFFNNNNRPSKKPLDFLDESKNEKLNLEKNPIEPKKLPSEILTLEKEKSNQNQNDSLKNTTDHSEIMSRPSQKKWPPENKEEQRPSQNNKLDNTEGAGFDLATKRSAKTVTSKIQGLQDKLGNLPLGMLQKPDDKFLLNPRRGLKKDEDYRPELDHDLTMEKPTMLKKKRPRGKKNEDFQESENDANLKFERKNNAITQKNFDPNNPVEQEQQSLESSQQNENNSIKPDKLKKGAYEEVEKLPIIFETNKSKTQIPVPDKKNTLFISDNPQLSKPIQYDNVKKPLKNLLDDSDELMNSNFRLSNQKTQQNPLPRLPDISNDRIESKTNIERPSEKKTKTIPIIDNPLESNNKLPALPNIFEDKPDKKKKKHPLDKPSEKVVEEKQKKKLDMFDEDENFSKPSFSKGNISKNNKDITIPPLPSKNIDNVLPDFKAPSYIAKPGEKESKKLRKLFDDDEDDGGGFLFKPKTENKTAFGNNSSMTGKKKGIFDD